MLFTTVHIAPVLHSDRIVNGSLVVIGVQDKFGTSVLAGAAYMPPLDWTKVLVGHTAVSSETANAVTDSFTFWLPDTNTGLLAEEAAINIGRETPGQ